MITKQSTLNNFCDFLPAARPMRLDKALEWELEPRISDRRYTVNLKGENTIEIEEMHCKDCGSLLYHNGYNPKQPVLDNGLGKRLYRVHRKRCPRCGEISPDYSVLAPRHGHYHGNFRRRTRQHFMNGLNPMQTRRVFKTDFQVNVPTTTIREWLHPIQEPIRNLLSSVQYPTTGHWQHDETFLSIRGKEHYALVTLDTVTGFALSTTVVAENGRSEASTHLRDIKRIGSQRILSITADGTNKFGFLLKTRSFKYTIRSQCLMHFKWRVSRKLKRLAGLGESSIKPLPRGYWTLRWLFYQVLDSHDETHAYICLERLRPAVQKIKKAFLTRLFNEIEGKLHEIIAWQRDPAIPRTNNKCENFNQQLEYHPSFNARCRIIFSAQFVVDVRTFRFNYSKLITHLQQFEVNWEEFKTFAMQNPETSDIKSDRSWYYWESIRLEKLSGKFDTFWKEYLGVKKRDGFVEPFQGNH